MSEKTFWIQKIQKTQFCFLTTDPLGLRKKLWNHYFELIFDQKSAIFIDISYHHYIGRNVGKKFLNLENLNKHTIQFSDSISVWIAE